MLFTPKKKISTSKLILFLKTHTSDTNLKKYYRRNEEKPYLWIILTIFIFRNKEFLLKKYYFKLAHKLKKLKIIFAHFQIKYNNI